MLRHSEKWSAHESQLRRINSEGNVRMNRLCLLRCRLLGGSLLRCGLCGGGLLRGSPLLGCGLGSGSLRCLGLGDTSGLCLAKDACDLLLNGRGGASGGSGSGLARLAGVGLRLSSGSSLLCGGGLLGRRSLLGSGGLCLLVNVLAIETSWRMRGTYSGGSLGLWGSLGLGSSLSLGGSRLLLLLLLLGLSLLGGSGLGLLLCELHGTGSTWMTRQYMLRRTMFVRQRVESNAFVAAKNECWGLEA